MKHPGGDMIRNQEFFIKKMMADKNADYSPYSFVQNHPILFFDPLGLDTVRVNGEGSHKIQVRQGDVLAWTIGKLTSYYTYDPNSPDAV